MSVSIDASFVKQYEREVHEAYQRHGSLLRPTVRHKTVTNAKDTTFQSVGKGVAGQKTRHGKVPVMNISHTPVTCTLQDWYAGDWIDKLDELKINHDERMVVANASAWVLGRKTDEMIVTVLDTATNSSAVDLTSEKTIRNDLLEAVQALNDRDVPDDGQRFGIIAPRMWAAMMTMEEFSSADYVGADGLPYRQGAPIATFKSWLNILWKQHTGVPEAAGNVRSNFIYHRGAVGHAVGAEITADVQWHNDRAAHFFMHMMSQGSCKIDDAGIEKITIDEDTALPVA